MNNEFKKAVLIALRQREISKVEAKALFRSNGKINLDLSTKSTGTDQSQIKILERVHYLRPYFQNIITLGNGSRP
ncbi:hypothetical protein LV84_03468 [Algoriphagus ratkowskyi]|uniref:Uncharacterized protein n=1 Tax=Algoriphagus ratkowskyi TaxID=57028 RepID=A0A2W7SNY8_9BACT|nr:hypothetical protein LV84_03468 [Algoriphagus ratkowskyi]